MKPKPAILLFRGRGIMSALIRWQTRGKYSHAALLLPDGQIVESWQTAGVRVKSVTDWSNIDVFDVPSVTDQQWDDAIKFALTKVGQKYDWLAILRFISRRKQLDNRKWFCSELVFESLRHAGVELLRDIDSSAVSPGTLGISPLLTKRTPLDQE